jgi:hypothetical protein
MNDFTCTQEEHCGSRHRCLHQCEECRLEYEEDIDEDSCPYCEEGQLQQGTTALDTKFKFCTQCDYIGHANS